MKLSAILVSRNDNYGGQLNERATYCINSLIDTFDEVIYVDWNSPTHSLLWDIQDDLQLKGNLKHIIITPEIAQRLVNYDPQAQVCNEVLGRNIGIRRATGDWIVSTNIDVITPRRDQLLKAIKDLDPKTFYTISRRYTNWEQIKEFHGGEIKFEDWNLLRDHLISTSEERKREEAVVTGDQYSLINCCGDFQIATNNVWNTIRGFEEDLIYVLYSDTNVQKKAKMHNFGLEAIYSPALFHIDHGKGGGGFLDGINKKTNDPHRAITNQNLTQNSDNWGFSDINIEFEVL